MKPGTTDAARPGSRIVAALLMIQIKAVTRLPPRWRMSFNPRRALIIEAAGIATVIVSVAALVVLFFAL